MGEGNFGEQLRAGRERRGLTLEAVARTTRVPQHVLEALEAADLTALPPEVYVRGFIRAVSHAVGVPEAEPLDRYRQALEAQRSAAAPAELSGRRRRPGRAGAWTGPWPRRLGLAVAVLVLALLAWIVGARAGS